MIQIVSKSSQTSFLINFRKVSCENISDDSVKCVLKRLCAWAPLISKMLKIVTFPLPWSPNIHKHTNIYTLVRIYSAHCVGSSFQRNAQHEQSILVRRNLHTFCQFEASSRVKELLGIVMKFYIKTKWRFSTVK